MTIDGVSVRPLSAADPETVGPYRLRQRLGSGGMGVVYLAEGTGGADGPVAVKCLPHGVGGAVRDRLAREAGYLAAVRHPRVAAFVAADTRADRPWVAMDYVPGPSLAEVSVPLGPAQLRHLTEGLADALAALHRQRLVHRDVKPGNIILTHRGPVLVDLGIAAGGDLTALTGVGTVIGTPEWMAPEQFGGSPAAATADVWGWGCVALFGATGRTPFGSGPLEALVHRIRTEPPDLRGLPDWLAGAVAVALAKNPEARPTVHALAGVDGIRRVSRVAGPPPRPAAPPARQPVGPAPRGRAPMAARPSGREPSGAPRSGPPRSDPPRRAHPAAERRPPSPAAAAYRPSPARRGRARLRRLVRRLLVAAVLAVTVVAIAVGAFAWTKQAVTGDPWNRTVGTVVRELGGA